MADNPIAVVAPSYRVVRIDSHVTETIIASAASPAAARLAAMALDPSSWQQRKVLQKDTQDKFEYDVVASDF